MRILVLGGTGFIGSHICEQLLGSKHDVTCFCRGVTQPRCSHDKLVTLYGDRDNDEAGIEQVATACKQGQRWDVCIDVSGYTGVHVGASASLLHRYVERYVYVSAVSVYGDPKTGPITEAHPLVAPAPFDVTLVEGDNYAKLKVTCEQIVARYFTNRNIILRPQIVVGDGDPTDRLSYWCDKAVPGVKVLVPGDGEDYVQVVDVRDLAAFVVTLVHAQSVGTFNISGVRTRWCEFERVLGLVAPYIDPIRVSAAYLRSIGLREPRLPLYRERSGPKSQLMNISNETALSQGLTLHRVKETIDYVRSSPRRVTMNDAIEQEQEQEILESFLRMRQT